MVLRIQRSAIIISIFSGRCTHPISLPPPSPFHHPAAPPCCLAVACSGHPTNSVFFFFLFFFPSAGKQQGRHQPTLRPVSLFGFVTNGPSRDVPMAIGCYTDRIFFFPFQRRQARIIHPSIHLLQCTKMDRPNIAHRSCALLPFPLPPTFAFFLSLSPICFVDPPHSPHSDNSPLTHIFLFLFHITTFACNKFCIAKSSIIRGTDSNRNRPTERFTISSKLGQRQVCKAFTR